METQRGNLRKAPLCCVSIEVIDLNQTTPLRRVILYVRPPSENPRVEDSARMRRLFRISSCAQLLSGL